MRLVTMVPVRSGSKAPSRGMVPDGTTPTLGATPPDSGGELLDTQTEAGSTIPVEILGRKQFRIHVCGKPVRKPFILGIGPVWKDGTQPALKDFFQDLFVF